MKTMDSGPRLPEFKSQPWEPSTSYLNSLCFSKMGKVIAPLPHNALWVLNEITDVNF